MTTDDGLKGLTDAERMEIRHLIFLLNSMTNFSYCQDCVTKASTWLEKLSENTSAGEGVAGLVATWKTRTKEHDELAKKTNNYQTKSLHTSCANVYETCADELEAILAEKGEV